MSGEIAELEARIQALSVEERVELMRILIADLDGVADANVEAALYYEVEVPGLGKRFGREVEHIVEILLERHQNLVGPLQRIDQVT